MKIAGLSAIIIYLCVVLLTGFCGMLAGIYGQGEQGLVLVAASQIALFMLTFPSGLIAFVFGAVPTWMGVVTPAEAIALMTPLYALLGYLQWWRVLPALYRR